MDAMTGSTWMVGGADGRIGKYAGMQIVGDGVWDYRVILRFPNGTRGMFHPLTLFPIQAAEVYEQASLFFDGENEHECTG